MKGTYKTVFGVLVLAAGMLPVKALAQACPACSNPALQSSEKLEAGTDTLHKGTFRITLNVTMGIIIREVIRSIRNLILPASFPKVACTSI
ncbi:MAG: hypothetical protein JKY18_13690 [Flavobacteriales bacterium]|nr:hypothetical protein [Flavobacteriales bacterium]